MNPPIGCDVTNPSAQSRVNRIAIVHSIYCNFLEDSEGFLIDLEFVGFAPDQNGLIKSLRYFRGTLHNLQETDRTTLSLQFWHSLPDRRRVLLIEFELTQQCDTRIRSCSKQNANPLGILQIDLLCRIRHCLGHGFVPSSRVT